MKAKAHHQSEDPLHQLFKAISLIKTDEEAGQFLQDLCTPAELQEMADRWRVVEPIKQEKPYREIYEITGVSITTIGRVARSVNFGNDGYNLIYERLKKSKNATKTKNSHSKKRETK